MKVIVGTSGWQYRDWKGPFYPPDLPQRGWLRYFSERFPTVEVNNTFYRLPKAETFASWREGSAQDFVFTVKVSRFLTHIKRLRDAADPLAVFWERVQPLGAKLGVILFQLPPNLRADHDLLKGFLALLPDRMQAAFEFRHPSWEVPDTHRLLDKAGCALVLADRPGSRQEPVVTAGWSYVRFHQGGHGPARSAYTRDKLRRWADRIAALEVRDVYVYFNNDPDAAAIRDACTLTELLRRRSRAEVLGPVEGP